MATIRTNAEQILRENFKQVEGDITLKESVEIDAQSDPNFFRWLFNEEFLNDFDSSLTEEHKEKFQEFLNEL